MRAFSTTSPIVSSASLSVSPRLWTPIQQRTGLIAIKKGMMPIYDKWGQQHPVTLLHVDRALILDSSTHPSPTHTNSPTPYLLMGCGSIDPTSLSTPDANETYRHNLFLASRLSLPHTPRFIAYFPVSKDAADVPIGFHLSAAHFSVGQFVDVRSVSIDKIEIRKSVRIEVLIRGRKEKGFQGVVKRWGFKGQSASHGTSLSHRSPGSIGNRKDPGKVWKGKKMPGHMGGSSVTIHNLRVIGINTRLNMLYVRGTVPGPIGSCVCVSDAKFKEGRKKGQFDGYVLKPHFPTISKEEVERMPEVVMWEGEKEDPGAKKLKMV